MLSSKSRAYRLCGLSQGMAIEKRGEWKGKKGEKEEEKKTHRVSQSQSFKEKKEKPNKKVMSGISHIG